MANELLPQEPEADETETRRRMDPELRCISAMLRMLEDLETTGARERVVAYLVSRYRGE